MEQLEEAMSNSKRIQVAMVTGPGGGEGRGPSPPGLLGLLGYGFVGNIDAL